MHYSHKSRRTPQRPPRIRHESPEKLSKMMPLTHTIVHEISRQALHRIEQRPPTHHNIIAQNQKRHQHPLITDHPPPPTRSQLLETINHIALRMSPDDKLTHHDRNTDNQDTHQIYQDKRSPTIVAHLSREAPHIAQSHSTTRCSKNRPHATAKINMFFHYLHTKKGLN